MDLKPLISGKEMNNHQLKASDFYHQRCSQVVLRLKDRGCKEGLQESSLTPPYLSFTKLAASVKAVILSRAAPPHPTSQPQFPSS